MPLKYVGPDATAATDLVTLGVGDARWAGATDLSTLAGRVSTLETNTQEIVCEVIQQADYAQPANSDVRLAMSMNGGDTTWGPYSSIFYGSGAGAGIGRSGYSRFRIPVSGYYRVQLWLTSSATTGSAACKILASSSTTVDPAIATDTIATYASPAVSEGTPLHCRVEKYFAVGTCVYGASWASVAGTIKAAVFTGVVGKFKIEKLPYT